MNEVAEVLLKLDNYNFHHSMYCSDSTVCYFTKWERTPLHTTKCSSILKIWVSDLEKRYTRVCTAHESEITNQNWRKYEER